MGLPWKAPTSAITLGTGRLPRHSTGSIRWATRSTIQSSDALVRRQKYPLMARGTSALAWTHSTYEAAQFYVRKEFSNGLQVRAGYTRMHVYGSDGTWQDEWAA